MLAASHRPPNAPEYEAGSHVFLLGWPLAKSGGVTGVVRSLIAESKRVGKLEPIVVEVMDTGDEPITPPDGPLMLQLPMPTPYNPKHPFRAAISFLLKLPLAFRRLRALCREHRVTVLNPHFVGLENATLSVFRKLGLFRGKLIFSFHGADARSLIQARGWERKLARWMLHGADVLVPCSEGLGEELRMLVPELAGRIEPIQNGIDAQAFVDGAAGYTELPPNFRNRKCLLNVAAFEYKKDHESLIRAFAKLRQVRNDACLVIAGQVREQFAETERLVSELGLTDDVLLLRNLPHNQVAGLLRACDVFVLSSRWEKGVYGEGFALALLEAGAMGKPVVSTLSCGVTELIKSGESGALVPPGDRDALADAMGYMLDHPAEAARQAANLQRRVREQFTWGTAYERYLRVAGVAFEPTRTAAPEYVDLACSGD